VAGPSVELLQKIPLFTGLKPRELEQLSGSFKERTFNAGETVATEGQEGAGFFVIESGEALVTVSGARTATITAASDLHTYGLTFWDFRPLVENDARVAWPLLQVMAKRLREAEAESATA